MSIRYFVFATQNHDYPVCPYAVARVGPDGTEEAFTRDLVWEPSDRLERLGGQLPPHVFEVRSDYAEQFLVDMVVEMREQRYGWRSQLPVIGISHHAWFRRRADALDLDAACALSRDRAGGETFTPEAGWTRSNDDFRTLPLLKWGNPSSPVRIALAEEEVARLMTRDLPGLRTDAGDSFARREFRPDLDSEYEYSAIFEQRVQVVDLLLAREVCRRPTGKPAPEEEWSHGGVWRPSFRTREMIREHNWYDEELPITAAEVARYAMFRTESQAMWARAYRPGN